MSINLSEYSILVKSDIEQTAVSLIIFSISFIGCLLNLLAGFTVLKSPVLKNAFGALCFSHTVANFGVLFVFLVWVAPTTFMQYEHTHLFAGKILGQVTIFFWNVCAYSHLVISINRFLAIAIPTRAIHLFNYRNTRTIIVIVWLMGFVYVIPYFFQDTCAITYDPASWVWVFPDTPCGHAISTYTDYYSSVIIFVIMSTLDLCTFTMLILHHRKSQLTSDNETKRRRRIEIRLFTQSCLQGVIFFYNEFNFYYVVTLSSNKWFGFMTSTFAWDLCHCLDGLVVIAFHFKRSLIRKESRPIIAVSEANSGFRRGRNV